MVRVTLGWAAQAIRRHSAAAKVRLSKFSDAVDKLQDISDTATAFANAPKPKLENAGAINGAVVTATAVTLAITLPGPTARAGTLRQRNRCARGA